MSLAFRKGTAEIEDSAARKGGGSFSFVPRIRWREDAESKFILVLTPIEEVVRARLHEWIPVGKGEKADGEEYTRWEDFIERTDPAIGEDYDDLTTRLDRDAKDRHIGVVVELAPVYETVKDRKKVKKFVAQTSTYTRKTDDGEIEMTQPDLGLVIESSKTFWGTMSSFEQSQGPLIGLPMQVIRRGKDQNTRYDGIPFIDVPVDLSPIIDHLDGISYLSDDMDDLLQKLSASEDDTTAAIEIADFFMMKRLHELADGERYEELVAPLEPEDMPKKFGKSKSGGKAKPARSPRPARQTRRQAVAEDAPDEQPAEAPEASEAPAEESGSKTDRFAALKARVEKK